MPRYTPRRPRLYLPALLGLSAVCAEVNAQNTPSYSLPGGVRVIQEGKLNASNKPYQFPDNVEARKWLVGFDRGLVKACPPDEDTKNKIGIEEAKVISANNDRVLNGTTPLSSLFTGGLIGVVSRYFSSIDHTYYPQGEEDAILLAKGTPCKNLGGVEFVVALVMLHSGREPDPDDLSQFLAMASPEFRKALGYDEEKADRIIHRNKGVSLNQSASRVVLLYGGAVGSFYAKGLTPEQRSAAYDEVAALSSQGQKVVECNYQGYQYTFWYDSVPVHYEQMTAGIEHHPLRSLGRVSVNGCPANMEVAQELRHSIEQGVPVHFTHGVPVVDQSEPH
ncbi:MAG: hypothetical protein JOY54_13625 [Acidobacteriaceae bacterium]|nr:hypothetical protein [Acidobacteriaceae bacterium]